MASRGDSSLFHLCRLLDTSWGKSSLSIGGQLFAISGGLKLCFDIDCVSALYFLIYSWRLASGDVLSESRGYQKLNDTICFFLSYSYLSSISFFVYSSATTRCDCFSTAASFISSNCESQIGHSFPGDVLSSWRHGAPISLPTSKRTPRALHHQSKKSPTNHRSSQLSPTKRNLMTGPHRFANLSIPASSIKKKLTFNSRTLSD